MNLGGTNLYPWFHNLLINSSSAEAWSSSLKPLRILNASMSRPQKLLCSKVKSPRSGISTDTLVANLEDKLESLDLHLLEAELGAVLKQWFYQCPIQSKCCLLVLIPKNLHYVVQDILCLNFALLLYIVQSSWGRPWWSPITPLLE